MSATKEEEISGRLSAQFPFLAGQVKIQRARRLWVETSPENFDAVFNGLVEKFGFNSLCTITGLDEGEYFGLLYHLAKEDGTVASLKVRVARHNPKWKSIGNKFPGGIIYEREIADLLGVQFEGLPPGPRYPLTDNWPAGQYPLRKDWQNTNVLPKNGGGA